VALVPDVAAKLIKLGGKLICWIEKSPVFAQAVLIKMIEAVRGLGLPAAA
jgi:hypothetical protein